jgi:hypothetical protein
MGAVVGETPPQPEGPLALPGSYEVRLSVDGQVYRQPLEIRMDPRVSTSRADLERQFQLELRVATALENNVRAYRELASLRSQLQNAKARAADARELVAAAGDLDRRAAMLAGSDHIAGDLPTLANLSGSLATILGAVESADSAPTAQEYAAFEQAQRSLAGLLSSWAEMKQKDVPAFSHIARQHGVPEVTIGAEPH